MSLFDFRARKLQGQYRQSNSVRSRSRSKVSGSIPGNFGSGGGQSSFGGQGGNTSGSGNFGMSRYSGTTQNMELGNITQEWMPKDPVGLHTLWRQIYGHCSVAGPALDLISNFLASGYDVMGLSDPGHHELFENAMKNLQVETLMAPLTREYLMIGRISGNLLFDESLGTWTGFMPHDPDFVAITPRPIIGLDPKLDLKLDPGTRRMLQSQDPRDQEALKMLPAKLVKQMQQGVIQLDPVNTLFVPRKTTLNDFVGTSVLTRLVPYWALEQNLITGTLIASRRRQRSVLHLSVGLDDLWEPEPQEIDDIINLFMQADEDPTGAIVGTKKGVEVQEIRDAQTFWKLGDDIQYLTEAKMRSLSINENFLSGEANFNVMDTALSVFMEMVRSLREHLTAQIFYHKTFPTLSRVYGLRKIKKNELEHRIRIKKSAPEEAEDMQKEIEKTTGVQQATSARYNKALNSLKSEKNPKIREKVMQRVSAEEAKMIKESELLIPIVHWHKQLRPQADENFLTILNTMEEKGIPIPLRVWASAGGIELEHLAEMLEEDAKLRIDIQDWKRSVGGSEQVAASVIRAKKSITGLLPIFRNQKDFMGLSKQDAVDYVGTFAGARFEMLSNPEDVEYDLHRHFEGNEHKIGAMQFILKRTGMVNFAMTKDVVTNVVAQLSEAGMKQGELLKEITVIEKYKKIKPTHVSAEAREYVRAASAQPDTFTGNNSKNLYAGLPSNKS
jgi:hypothetical protein